MTTTLWLRISSAISLLFAAGHALGGLQNWSPIGENPVLESMRAFRFDAMGVNRSYFDFYMGFGHTLTATTVMQSVLLWQLARLASTSPADTRPMIAVFALAAAACGVIAWQFIFPLPAIFLLALLTSLIVAFVVAR